jgi:hypothetical protein
MSWLLKNTLLAHLYLEESKLPCMTFKTNTFKVFGRSPTYTCQKEQELCLLTTSKLSLGSSMEPQAPFLTSFFHLKLKSSQIALLQDVSFSRNLPSSSSNPTFAIQHWRTLNLQVSMLSPLALSQFSRDREHSRSSATRTGDVSKPSPFNASNWI